MKKITFFVILILCLFIINNFFHSIYRLWQKQDLMTTAEKELDRQRLEQKKLRQELAKVQNPSYIEEEARNKLFLIRPGEQVVVLPEASVSPERKQKVTREPDPAWQQWYRLLF
jgi:cell division protein FtsB